MNNFSTWLTVVMLVIFSTMVAVATTYPPGAQFMPFVVGIPGIVLCLFQLAQDYLPTRYGTLAGQFHSEPRAGDPPPAEDDLPEFGPHTIANEITMWVYLVGFIAGLVLFGFLVAVPILICVYLHREAGVRLPAAILSGAATVSVMWFLFEYVLRFQLHAGFVAEWALLTLGR